MLKLRIFLSSTANCDQFPVSANDISNNTPVDASIQRPRDNTKAKDSRFRGRGQGFGCWPQG